MITAWTLCMLVAGRELCDLGYYRTREACQREADSRRGAYCQPERRR